MKKSISFIAFIISLSVITITNSCAELQTVAQQAGYGMLKDKIPNGLKEALELGVKVGVSELGQNNGFYKDQAAKILLPAELRKVDNTLRSIGLDALANEGLKVLNRAAEDAVSEASPIFISAIRQLTFKDAMQILQGDDYAATNYLKRTTTTQLKQAFQPKIANSLDKVGANEIWSKIIQKYNSVPLVKPVNADLTDYVTEQAIIGLFTKVGMKEKDIRNNYSARTTPLLKEVFAMQD